MPPVDDALEAMQALASETGLDLSNEGLAAGMPQASEEPQAEPAAQQPQAKEPEPAAAKSAATPAAPQEPQQHMVPVAVLTEQRREFQRLIEELKKPAKPEEKAAAAVEIDPFMDPKGFARAEARALFESQLAEQVSPVLDQLRVAIAHNNKATATSIHTAEVVERAQAAFDEALPKMDQAEAARVMRAPNPFHAAVEWMKQRDLLAEVGGDANAYRERLRAELRAELEAEQAAAGNSGPPQQQPRNVAGQFASAPKSPAAPLPSVSRAGSGAGATPLKAPEPGDMELVDGIINAKPGQRPDWAN